MNDKEILIEVNALDGWKFIAGGKDDFGVNFSDLANKDHVTILFEKRPNFLEVRDHIVPIIEKEFYANHDFSIPFMRFLYNEHRHPECEEIDLEEHFNKHKHAIQLALVLSTARQLCCALLKSKGKWKE